MLFLMAPLGQFRGRLGVNPGVKVGLIAVIAPPCSNPHCHRWNASLRLVIPLGSIAENLRISPLPPIVQVIEKYLDTLGHRNLVMEITGVEQPEGHNQKATSN